MSEFITYREKNLEGELMYFILQKEFPHFNCFIADRPVVNFMQPMPIDSYNLWICLLNNKHYICIAQHFHEVLN